jgi:hypothetical protein
MLSKPQTFLNLKDCISFETSQGRKLTGMPSATVASRIANLASTCLLWSHTSHDLRTSLRSSLRLRWLYQLVNIWGLRENEMQMAPLEPHFCKKFRNMPYCLRCDFAVCQLRFLLFKNIFRIILLIFRVTKFKAVLHAGSQVSCHNTILSFLLCFNNRLRLDAFGQKL